MMLRLPMTFITTRYFKLSFAAQPCQHPSIYPSIPVLCKLSICKDELWAFGQGFLCNIQFCSLIDLFIARVYLVLITTMLRCLRVAARWVKICRMRSQQLLMWNLCCQSSQWSICFTTTWYVRFLQYTVLLHTCIVAGDTFMNHDTCWTTFPDRLIYRRACLMMTSQRGLLLQSDLTYQGALFDPSYRFMVYILVASRSVAWRTKQWKLLFHSRSQD